MHAARGRSSLIRDLLARPRCDILVRNIAAPLTVHTLPMPAIFSRPATAWACLMYHQVLPTEPPPGASGYFAVSRAQFAAQLDHLTSLGFRGASLEEAAAAAETGTVAITFDDGDWTSYAVAFPELVARGMTATFFVITSKIGSPGFASWDELREMTRAGMSVQSHTHSHPFLSSIGADAMMFELRESKRLLDGALQQDTVGISLPNGDHPRGGALTAARSAGYQWVATSGWGPNTGDIRERLVRRYTVRRATTISAFDRLVRARPSVMSLEGMRLAILHELRALLGPSRYARWRRQFMRLRRG